MEPVQIIQEWGNLMRDFILIKCYWSVLEEFLMMGFLRLIQKNRFEIIENHSKPIA